MSLAKQIDDDYIKAYKAKNQQVLEVLRLLKAAAKNQQVELRRELSDAEYLAVIQKQAKQRQDSIEQFRAAKRDDLADKEAVELTILQEYLPKQLSEAELEAVIDKAISETAASDIKAMGAVMAKIMAQYPSQVDGKILSSKVRSRLTV